MRNKIYAIIVFMLLTTSIFPMIVSAGDPENPEFVDRILDVKLFGVITFPFQMNYKYADVVAAWLDEESINPDYLSVSLQIRDLEEKTDLLEAIYDVDFVWKNDRFIVCLHINPYGIGSFVVGRSLDGNDEIDEWIECDGMVDVDQNMITWIVPKAFLGNPSKGSTITSIHPSTHLRFTDDSGLSLMDLFKDLSWNGRIEKEYKIQY